MGSQSLVLSASSSAKSHSHHSISEKRDYSVNESWSSSVLASSPSGASSVCSRSGFVSNQNATVECDSYHSISRKKDYSGGESKSSSVWSQSAKPQPSESRSIPKAMGYPVSESSSVNHQTAAAKPSKGHSVCKRVNYPESKSSSMCPRSATAQSYKDKESTYPVSVSTSSSTCSHSESDSSHSITKEYAYPVSGLMSSSTGSRSDKAEQDEPPCHAIPQLVDNTKELQTSTICSRSASEETQSEAITTNAEVYKNTESITMESGIVEDTMDTCVALLYSEQSVLCVDQSENSQPCWDGYITCPQCRSEHIIVGSSGIDGFLTDFVIESRLRVQSQSSAKLSCDECDSTESVVSLCDDCSEYLCDFCTTAHQRQRRFVGHKIRKTWEVDVKKDKQRKSTFLLCPKHQSETIQLFCQQCDAVVCNECIVNNHSAHKLSKINSITRESINEQLLSLASKIDKELTLQEENLKYVTEVEKVTSDMATEIQRKIDNDFDAYIAALETRREKLLADSEDKCTAKLKVLWSERDCLERVIADIDSNTKFYKTYKRMQR